MESFNFTLIENEFDELLIAIENRIDRDWAKKYPNLGNGRLLVLNYFQLAKNYHKTVDFLCDDNNKNPFLSLSVAPLVRSIFEILYVLIYFLDDVPEKTKSFSVTMYREQKRVLNIWEDKYNGIPEWNKRIEETKDFLVKAKSNFKGDFGQVVFDSVDWENDKTNRLPSFREMRKSFEENNPEVFSFLKFLDDKWYRELSLFAHPEPFGLAQIRTILMDNDNKKLRIFKNENLWLSLILIMSIASEIDIALNFELKTRLAYFWTLFSNYSYITKEIYEMRYQKLLNE